MPLPYFITFPNTACTLSGERVIVSSNAFAAALNLSSASFKGTFLLFLTHPMQFLCHAHPSHSLPGTRRFTSRFKKLSMAILLNSSG